MTQLPVVTRLPLVTGCQLLAPAQHTVPAPHLPGLLAVPGTSVRQVWAAPLGLTAPFTGSCCGCQSRQLSLRSRPCTLSC